MRASHCSGFSSCGVQVLGTWLLIVVAHGLQSARSLAEACRLAAPRHVGSSRTRNQTSIPYISENKKNEKKYSSKLVKKGNKDCNINKLEIKRDRKVQCK